MNFCPFLENLLQVPYCECWFIQGLLATRVLLRTVDLLVSRSSRLCFFYTPTVDDSDSALLNDSKKMILHHIHVCGRVAGGKRPEMTLHTPAGRRRLFHCSDYSDLARSLCFRL